MSPKLLIGADIEFFVKDKETRTLVFPKNIPGTKEQPFKISNDGILNNLDVGVTVDGASVEVTMAPSTCDNFSSTISNTLHFLDLWLLTKGLVRSSRVSVIRNKIQGIPKYLEKGCAPDFFAYSKPTLPRDTPVDYKREHASGHIHFGTNKFKTMAEVPPYIQAKFADVILGLGFRVLYGKEEKYRIPYYGVPGLFRPKPYGIEYRVPSNQWAIYQSPLYSHLALLERLCSQDIRTIRKLYGCIPWGLVRTALEGTDLAVVTNVNSLVQEILNGFLLSCGY